MIQLSPKSGTGTKQISVTADASTSSVQTTMTYDVNAGGGRLLKR